MDEKVYRDFPTKKTEFSQYETEYFLNKDGQLEAYPAPRDCQAIIDSNLETTLQKILDSLMQPVEGTVNESDEYVQQRNSMLTDLDILLDSDVLVGEISDAYNLGTKSKKEVINFLQEQVMKDYETYKTEKELKENAQNTSESQGE